MDQKIILLTGETGEGKTTALINWMKSGKKRVHGILMPVVNGKRSFYNPYMDVNVLAEAPKDKLASELIFEVGKFKFSKKSFKIAASWLKMKPPLNTDYLVVDEIGPLELRAEGLEPEFSEFIERVKNGEINQTVILVVRKTLTNQVLKHYKLDSVRVIQKEELEHI